MMPGETNSKPVGIASEAAGACQNCTALQQSLNEYVTALLGLKQRIIDSEENDTLRCQLEQVLQKVSPQEQHQEDVKSLRAELEEKTVTYTICNYVTLLEVSVKHFQDFKKLKMEKKALVKELKKMQNKLACSKNGKLRKATKNAQTQIVNDEPVVSVDKRKIKFLLEELWGCIDSSPNESQFHFQLLDEHLHIAQELKATDHKNGRRARTQRSSDENKITPNHSSPFTINELSAAPAELPVITGSNESKGPTIPEETVAECNGDSAFYEEKTPDYLVPDLADSYSLSTDHGKMTNEFLELLDWARPLPPLLSPITFSPSASQDTLFGEYTDSSYEEEGGSTEGSFLRSKMEYLNSSANQICSKEQTNLIDVCERVNESNYFLKRRRKAHLDFPKQISKNIEKDACPSFSHEPIETTGLNDEQKVLTDNFPSVLPITRREDLTMESIEDIVSGKTIDLNDCNDAFPSKISTSDSSPADSEIVTVSSTATNTRESHLDRSESYLDKAMTQRTDAEVCSLSERLQTKENTKIFCQEHEFEDVSCPQQGILLCDTEEKMNGPVHTETSMAISSHSTASPFQETVTTVPHNSFSCFQNNLNQDKSAVKQHGLITPENNSGKCQETSATAEEQGSLEKEQVLVIGPSSKENMAPSCSDIFLSECVHSDNEQVQQSQTFISESDANNKCRTTSIKELEVSIVVTSSGEEQEPNPSHNQPKKSCDTENSTSTISTIYFSEDQSYDLNKSENEKTQEREKSADKVSACCQNGSDIPVSSMQNLSDQDRDHNQVTETVKATDRRGTDKIKKTLESSTNLLSIDTSLTEFKGSTKESKINDQESKLANNYEQSYEDISKKLTNSKFEGEKNESQNLVGIDSGKISSFLHSIESHVEPGNEVSPESYHQLLSKTSNLSLQDSVMASPLKEINTKSLQAASLQGVQNSGNSSAQNNDLSLFGIKETYRNARLSKGCLDSDDSEDDFPVRKVSYLKSSTNNFVKSIMKGTSGDSFLNIENANDNTSQLAADDLTDRSVEAEVKHSTKDAIVKRVTDINSDEQNNRTVDLLKGNSNSAEMHNDPLKNTNAINCVTVEKELNSNHDNPDIGNEKSFKDQESQDVAISDKNVQKSEMHNAEDQSAQNDNQPPSRSRVPGKNLIWNFERLDDFPDPGVKKYKISLEKKPGKNISASKILKGTSNPVNSSSGTESRRETHNISQVRALSLNNQSGQTVLANADTSTKTQHSPEIINKVRSEMGPPLPPLLGPLLATPPRTVRPLSPVMSSSSRSSLPSPLDDLISPLRVTPVPPVMSPVSDHQQYKSPMFTTPSPSEKGSQRILSSPLQFCAATPKHALPVPGRLPPSAAVNSTPTVQENSVKILDTMYPELSARARTLNILKGNVQLNRCLPGDCKPVSISQISGFKTITSTSTAFIKTGSCSKTSNDKDGQKDGRTNQSSSSCSVLINKRSSDYNTMPKSAKRLRLDSESPVAANLKACFTAPADKSSGIKEEAESCNADNELATVRVIPATDEDDVAKALKKVEELCFDLLPVIMSHIYIGTLPQIPVTRNEEKEVIYEFSSIKKGKAEDLLHAILMKLKNEKASLDCSVIQALCRVYTGLCRQIGDLERACVLCYSIITEDFPEPDKLILFIISSWSNLLSLNSVISKALQALLKQLAKGDVRICLSAYLNWEKSPPQNTSVILQSVLMAIQLGNNVKFHQSEQFGEDLNDKNWEYVFAVNLLCYHHKWIWTHENVISKQLWPVLDKWVKSKKGCVNIAFVSDVAVATVLRLVGCLCQMGLKEGFTAAVKNISAVIIAFIKHAKEEDMSWGVQLASVYMLCDVAPCDPGTIHKTLDVWKKAATNNIPPAVKSALADVASLAEAASLADKES
ncbi:hypothetical protein XELAEV_18031353mg [Xenopus laevis]|uniref:Little elongation complex subunit 1 C-terminal domain-containing protein n=1 Tax=Xenopus laevis TaxID=8355 RepID=A0A974CP26_XENLA|nr:hypothetical protein XELAEV_18031353mg [Xenopus laevis]